MLENYNNVRAVLNELRQALKQLRETGETYSIYIEKTGLSDEEQVEVLETLGRGHITITFNETDQPVEWYETQFSGIWVGTYKNGRDDSILHTVEVSRYPDVVGAFDEDIMMAEDDLTTWIDAAGL
ncbi:hydrogenase expression/formation C-terminal domain-containing protein [Veillonella caviae]|uniref:hydrogenase expression/formation C-terminal domain-containing protein n=1 Tax=Veillonella caviae TaxID=248316 RepID=UPI000F8F7F2D|nr:hydrogenase expression/formation C-terminal domain-containing protein [Veillonella caviae]MCF0156989.1 hydrogenase expression/formation protein [Veillonella sp.]MCI5709106.1 hydrogenase expression/formation protein [Veillonella caviae]MDY5715012.1 hydrogenase expression/formation C-terminal domain-containing protein [Veillonella caviae]